MEEFEIHVNENEAKQIFSKIFCQFHSFAEPDLAEFDEFGHFAGWLGEEIEKKRDGCGPPFSTVMECTYDLIYNRVVTFQYESAHATYKLNMRDKHLMKLKVRVEENSQRSGKILEVIRKNSKRDGTLHPPRPVLPSLLADLDELFRR